MRIKARLNWSLCTALRDVRRAHRTIIGRRGSEGLSALVDTASGTLQLSCIAYSLCHPRSRMQSQHNSGAGSSRPQTWVSQNPFCGISKSSPCRKANLKDDKPSKQTETTARILNLLLSCISHASQYCLRDGCASPPPLMAQAVTALHSASF